MKLIRTENLKPNDWMLIFDPGSSINETRNFICIAQYIDRYPSTYGVENDYSCMVYHVNMISYSPERDAYRLCINNDNIEDSYPFKFIFSVKFMDSEIYLMNNSDIESFTNNWLMEMI